MEIVLELGCWYSIVEFKLVTKERRRITSTEEKYYKDILGQWNDWKSADNIINEIYEISGLYSVSQRGLQFWREMHVGMSCFYLTKASRIRLGSDPPDFQLDYNGTIRSFEVADVMPMRRTRGKEYDHYAHQLNANLEIGVPSITWEDQVNEYNSMPVDLERIIEKKKIKNYKNKDYILILDLHYRFNHEIYRESEEKLKYHAQGALSCFSEVWIRKGLWILQVSPRGATVVSESIPY